MFKIGDKVVYNTYESANSINAGLEFQKIYIIKHKFTRWLYFAEDETSLMGPFHQDDFVLLTDLRKQKLEKICSKLEI